MSVETPAVNDTATPATDATSIKLELARLTQIARAALQPDAIPDALKAIQQWVCWRWELPEKEGGRFGKPPVDAKTGNAGKTNDPATWSDFATAVTRFRRDERLAGIGLAMTPDLGITALDLDHVIADGDVDQKASALLKWFGSTYAEISPSGTGYRLFCYGKPQREGHSDPRWLELYIGGRARYMTVTGNAVDGHPAAIAAMQGELDRLHSLYMERTEESSEKASEKAGKTTPPCVCNPSDRLAAALKNQTIAALYGGSTLHFVNAEGKPDRSAAEISLALRLMTFADGDEQTVHEWMDGSQCGKWLERDKDTDSYRVTTIKAAAATWDGKLFEDRKQREEKNTDTGGGDDPSRPDPDNCEVPDEFCLPDSEPELDTDGMEIDRLAALNLLDYDRQRGAAAQRLGVRADTLDKMVKQARGDKVETGGGKAMCFREVTPWSEPINLDHLLTELTASVRRFMSLPDHAAPAIALWTVYSYLVVSHGHIAPTLAITSPEKRCGKSTLLGWLYRVVEKPMLAANITAAAIFRTIDAWSPTLLIDEADSFLGESGDELRGILNSGHTRDTAYVIRVSGEELEPRQFSTWGAKVVALIGKLEGKYSTLADRSIEIQLRRRLPGDKVEKLRHADAEHFENLAAKCFRFALDHGIALGKARPEIPDALHDRAADNWEPLLAIADVAGSGWSRLARSTALALSGGADDDASNAGLGVQLLTDLRNYFSDRPTFQHHTTTELLNYLNQIDDAPWSSFAKGKPMTARHLARWLKPYGIIPQSIRTSATSTPKGYTVADFKDAFDRYLPSIRNAATNKATSSESPYSASATDRHCGGYENASSPSPQAGCGGVADKKPGSGSSGTVADSNGENWEEF